MPEKIKKPSWLSDAVFYQIFPASFADSNADGTGDIKGIMSKLDYLEWLGVNALWINPCYDSPFNDAGYDVRDYYKVAPRYGSNADMKRLFREAGSRGIKVCLDMVPGHTSIDHPWFIESCKAKRNKYSDWYIWTDSMVSDTTPPMKCIRGYAERDGNFAVNFHWSQPALNYGFAKREAGKSWQLPVDHTAARQVRREMIKIMRYWLDMGAAGFRVDMAFSLIKNDRGWREGIRLWQSVFEEMNGNYPEAAFISEWSSPVESIKSGFNVDMLLPRKNGYYSRLFHYESERDRYNARFFTPGDSYFDKKGKGDINGFLRPFMSEYKKVRSKGYIAIPSGNHDIFRLSIGRSRRELKVIFAFLMTMPALPFMYYGDEIGMRQISGLPSKEGAYKRTGVRTPMQWNDGKNAGFSRASHGKLYLPVDNRKNRPTVESQRQRDGSLLNEVRKLIQLRKYMPVFNAGGKFEPVYAENGGYPFIYIRRKGRESALVCINPAGRKVTAATGLKAVRSDGMKLLMGTKAKLSDSRNGLVISQAPVSYSIYEIV